MEAQYNTPEEALNALKSEFKGIPKIAEFLDVSPTLLYNYYNGHRENISPTVLRKLRLKDLIPYKKRIRTEITWESEEQKEALLNHAQFKGYKSIPIFMRQVANGLVEISNMSPREFLELHGMQGENNDK